MCVLTFDNERAVIEPEDIVSPLKNCPKTVITCFAYNLVAYAKEKYQGKLLYELHTANMEIPFYEIEVAGKKLGLIMSFVGAPACCSLLEELFVLGVEQVVVFGTCGVLSSHIEDVSIIVPSTAVREEGTSYHYAPASDEIQVNVETLDLMKQYFADKKIHYTVGKTWTTDAFYRETKSKVKKRKDAGCVCVEMECSAIAALANYRKKRIAQFFYAADRLDQEVWNAQSLGNEEKIDDKYKVVALAVELGLQLETFQK